MCFNLHRPYLASDDVIVVVDWLLPLPPQLGTWRDYARHVIVYTLLINPRFLSVKILHDDVASIIPPVPTRNPGPPWRRGLCTTRHVIIGGGEM